MTPLNKIIYLLSYFLFCGEIRLKMNLFYCLYFEYVLILWEYTVFELGWCDTLPNVRLGSVCSFSCSPDSMLTAAATLLLLNRIYSGNDSPNYLWAFNTAAYGALSHSSPTPKTPDHPHNQERQDLWPKAQAPRKVLTIWGAFPTSGIKHKNDSIRLN